MYAFYVMVKELSEVRVCDMLLLTLICSISLSNSAAVADKQVNKEAQTSNASVQSSAASLFHREVLTANQSKSTVTIELNCTAINTKNRKLVEPIYWNVHTEILKTLRHKKSTKVATTLSTSSADTTLTSDPPTSTAIHTIAITVTAKRQPAPGPPPTKRKKRQQTASNGDGIDAKDLRFVEVDPETDDHGIFTMSLLLVIKEHDDVDAGNLLLEAANQTYQAGNLERGAGVPVVKIYSGPPENRATMLHQRTDYKYLIWPLVILLVVVLFIVLGVFIYYKKKNKVTKLKITESNKG